MGKQNNYGQGGDGGRYKRFGGTGSLGNYDRGSGHRNLPNDNRRSGNWGGGDFRRSFDNSGNSGNNNNYGGSNIPPLIDEDDNRFQKFRDQSVQDKYRDRQGRNRNRNQRSGKQNYGKNARKDSANWHGDRNGTAALQNEPQQDYSQALPASAPAPVPVAHLSQQVPPVPEHGTSSPAVPPPIQNDLPQKTELNENSPIIKNIKQERIEAKDIKQVAKPPAFSSSSSESSESESENEPPTKTVQEVVKSNLVKVKEETTGKPTQSSVKNPPTSSSSSSSSEEGDSSDESTEKSKVSSKQINKIIKKDGKKPEKEKQLSEEDLICLGKLERKFVIEDDASEDADVSIENQRATSKSQCLICDKQGHTAFECQMICKNCSAPYHNMKSCPKPVNLSTMMQSFMEFCMGQMSQFNPEKKFTIPLNKSNIPNENILPTENLQIGSAVQSKKSKKNAKSKEPPKKATKRKRRYTSKSSDEEEEEDDDETEEEESDSSEEVVKQKIKKRRTKTPAVVDTPDYGIPFVPPFSSFPGFGATAATYNPLLLSQLMQSGVFGTPKKR
ncbi:protein mushroom body miniature [Anastrepha obliqua]|uniref:protein mushroom body miniature n=1 Tax=Anastrepha obliqua TaxID=95512 RepID=UPI00240A66C6|nr:protein mushroom body miniature [Anastrepha obliqua]